MPDLMDPTNLVKNFGYLGVFLTIFLESGIIFGFFLPGDSLLFAAGLLASQGYINIFALIGLAVAGAILGNNVGYYTGKKTGPALFNRPKSLFFSPKRAAEVHQFFENEGGKALVLARFIPAARTLIPIIAGVGRMPYRAFFTYNAIGGVVWGVGVPLLGYTLGKTVPNIDKYILPAIAVIIVLSAVPAIMHYLKLRRNK